MPGVVVALPQDANITEYVQVNSGTLPASSLYEHTASKSAYEPGAVVPRFEWRGPTRDEAAILSTPHPAGSVAMSVALVQFGATVEHHLSTIREECSGNRRVQALKQILGRKLCRDAFQAISTVIDDRFRVPGCLVSEAQAGGFCVKLSEHPTTTVNPRTNLLVGLHLDDWYDLPLAKRKHAANRICLNAGDADRFFLFLNVPIWTICEILRRRPLDELKGLVGGERIASCDLESLHRSVGGTNVARAFMQLFPDYPVVRIRIGPGQAYMAPTEGIVHDAGGGANPDVTIMLRGFFRPSD